MVQKKKAMVTVSLRLEESDKLKMDEMCVKMKSTKSEVARWMIESLLERFFNVKN